MVTFVDRVLLHATAGDGGHGCASIHREKFKPLGGPDGGSGGRGGDIVLVVDANTTTLLDFHFHPHVSATSGKAGQGSHKTGAEGKDLVLKVPNGTVVLDQDGNQIVDLIGAGTKFVLAKGGNGGLGNAALASPKRKAPGFALFGEPGEAVDVYLELKSVADVALVGYPSAGKSSLIAAISAARPKIADYPFTTLVPNLGVVNAGDHVITVADVPGLIPGASEGKGLGHEFLRHVERCSVIVHVVDCATLENERDPINDLEIIQRELMAYDEVLGTDLAKRPRLVALNKIDVPDARVMVELVQESLEARGLATFAVSAASREGLRPLTIAMGELVAAERASKPVEVKTRIVIRPKAIGEIEFTIRIENDDEGGTVYTVRGYKPERWVTQTNFGNDEAIGYLADRLATLGVEAELIRMGAKAGSTVQIGDVMFDWEPTAVSGVGGSAIGPGAPRGTDDRLSDNERMSAAERRAFNDATRRPGDDKYVAAWNIDDEDNELDHLGRVDEDTTPISNDLNDYEEDPGEDGVQVEWVRP